MSKLDNVVDYIKKNVILLAMIFLVIGIVVADYAIGSSSFLSSNNMMNLLMQVSISGLMGCGMTVALITGEFAISIGSVMTLSGTVFAICLGKLGLFPALILALLTGAFCGLVEGTIIAKGGVSSFICTTGTMYVWKGIALLLEDDPVSISIPLFRAINSNKIWYVVIMVIAMIATTLMLKYTKFGRNLHACGANPVVATNCGLNVANHKVSSLVIAQTFGGLAGILGAIRLESSIPTLGDKFGLIVTISCILGGTQPSGGEGNVLKSFIGFLILAVISNGFDLIGISGYYQQAVQGLLVVLIIGSVAYSNYGKKSSLN